MKNKIQTPPADVAAIREAASQPGIIDRIRRPIAPSLGGLEKEKEALGLQLFSGIAKTMPDGRRIRGDIHILLVGDPGTGKSELLMYLRGLAPRAVFAVGGATTAAGPLPAAGHGEV